MRSFYWSDRLAHYGIPGQKWGVKNGPPYPLGKDVSAKIRRGTIDKHEYVEIDTEVKQSSELKKLKPGYDVKTVRYAINHPEDGSRGRTYNCPNCAVAFEMTERGYDVHARPANYGSNVGDIERFFKDGKLSSCDRGDEFSKLKKPPNIEDYNVDNRLSGRKNYKKYLHDSLDYDQTVSRIQKETGDQLISKLKNQGNAARGIMVVGWRMSENPKMRTRAFHAFNYKIVGDDVVFFDAQSRREYKYNAGFSVNNFIFNCDPRDIYYMRTDNLDIQNVKDAVYSK